MATTTIAATDPKAQEMCPKGRFFADQTFHFETLRNAATPSRVVPISAMCRRRRSSLLRDQGL